MTMPEDEQLDRLTMPQLIAFLWNEPEVGPERLRKMFFDAPRTKPLAREWVEEWIDELEDMGLFKQAKLMEEFAETCPSKADPKAFCDYVPGSLNEKSWLAMRRQDVEAHRRQREERKRKLKLRKSGLSASQSQPF